MINIGRSFECVIIDYIIELYLLVYNQAIKLDPKKLNFHCLINTNKKYNLNNIINTLRSQSFFIIK